MRPHYKWRNKRTSGVDIVDDLLLRQTINNALGIWREWTGGPAKRRGYENISFMQDEDVSYVESLPVFTLY